MDTKVVRDMALMIANQIEASGPVKGEWAPWPLAEPVNRLFDPVAQAVGNDVRPLLPARFVQSGRRGLAVARYLDLAIAAKQIAALLPETAHKVGV